MDSEAREKLAGKGSLTARKALGGERKGWAEGGAKRGAEGKSLNLLASRSHEPISPEFIVLEKSLYLFWDLIIQLLLGSSTCIFII